jgi:hypothetical protein
VLDRDEAERRWRRGDRRGAAGRRDDSRSPHALGRVLAEDVCAPGRRARLRSRATSTASPCEPRTRSARTRRRRGACA